MTAHKTYAAFLILALPLLACAEPEIEARKPAAEMGGDSAAQAERRPLANEAMLALAQRHAEMVLKTAPEQATQLGVSEALAGEGYQARLDDYSPLAREEASTMNDRFLQDLRAVDRDALSGTARVTYDVLLNAYRTAAMRNQFGFGSGAVLGSMPPYVITQLSGPHIGIPRLLLNEQPLATAADAEDYLARLEALPTALAQTADSLLLDAEGGVTPPYFAIDGIIRSIEGLTAPAPGDHPLIERLEGGLADAEGVDAQMAADTIAKARAVLRDRIYPAYAELAETLASLKPAAGSDAGVWRLDGGAAFYQHALDGYGAEGRTPDEIHQLGLDEVARISAEMNAIFETMGMTEGKAGERFAALAEDPDMVFPNNDAAKEALLNELRDQVEEIDRIAPDWFGTLPPQAVEVRRIPVYEQDSAPGGYYTSPSLDGERPGIYWINLKDTADWPRYTLKTLTYHEAVPGHHFQVALAQDVDDMPLLRKMIFLSEFGEGWALYAEDLAEEMGMYEGDPLGRLGKLQSELFRAGRLVVDTGLHHKRWTREEAIDWMVANTGESRASVTREIERYSVWPGQAVSYKLGQIKIRELRARAEAELGAAFDIKAFHDAVLAAGAVPLPVLDDRVEAFIDARRAS